MTIYAGREPAVLAWPATVQSVGVRDITWVFLTAACSDGVAKAMARPCQMLRAKLPPGSPAQGGYRSVLALVRGLNRIDGPITRARVTQALRSAPAEPYSMAGMPIQVGDHAAHNPNRAALPMQLVEGFWRIAAHEWIKVPVVLSP